MKKVLIIIIVFAVLASCKKDIQNLNEGPKLYTDVPPATLFSNAQKNLADIHTSSSVNRNIFRLIVQHWTETTYTDEANYDLTTRSLPDQLWNIMYRDIIINLEKSKSLIPQQDPQVVSDVVKKNEIAMCDITEVFAFSILVNTFGNIPYTDALKVDSIVQPKFDDAQTVYYALLDKLDAALAQLDNTDAGFGDADLIYGGSIDKWKLFANSLKLKLAMVIADSDPTKAKTLVEQAAPNVFTSNSDNATFQYLGNTPNTNPIWVDLVQSGRHDFIACKTLMDKMNSLADPRIPLYLVPNANGVYIGAPAGLKSSFTAYASPSAQMLKTTFPGDLLDYSETEFILAEAKERGFNVSGTAEEHYNNAIRSSILYWNGTDASATTYLASANVKYTTAAGTWKQKIGLQKWIAEYNRGYDAWIDVRRLDYPEMAVPDKAQSGFPNRFNYPVKEQNVNTNNYDEAVKAIGGQDKVEVKLFWDKL